MTTDMLTNKLKCCETFMKYDHSAVTIMPHAKPLFDEKKVGNDIFSNKNNDKTIAISVKNVKLKK